MDPLKEMPDELKPSGMQKREEQRELLNDLKAKVVNKHSSRGIIVFSLFFLAVLGLVIWYFWF